MYFDFFGFKEPPFNLTPDTHFLFPSTHHQEALDHLQFGIRNRKGFILITGEVGCGKTTLCRMLVKNLGADTDIALILNSSLSDLELLRAINKEFNLSVAGTTREELIHVFNEFLIRERNLDRNVVVLIDESQNLSLSTLEQIRMLSNLETEKEKLLQIILVGQPELRQILNSQTLRQLNQRMAVKYHIQPLTARECRQYIEHRVKAAGAEPGAIEWSAGAMALIHRATAGIPRRINVVCEYALLHAFNHNTRRITRSAVRGAIEELSDRKALGISAVSDPLPWIKRVLLSLIVGLGLAALILQGPLAARLSRLQPPPETPETAPAAIPAVTPPASAAADDFAFEATPSGALFNLINLWQSGISLQSEAKLSPSAAASYIETTSARFQFACLQTWADLDFLIHLRLPFIMEIKGSSPAPRYITVTGVSDAKIEFMADAGSRTVTDRATVEHLFRGRSFVLFKGLKFHFTPITLGSTGEAVSELQTDLGKLGYCQGAPSGTLDADTDAALRRFQQDQHLTVDGVLCPETLFLIKKMSLEGSSEIPVLKTKIE